MPWYLLGSLPSISPPTTPKNTTSTECQTRSQSSFHSVCRNSAPVTSHQPFLSCPLSLHPLADLKPSSFASMLLVLKPFISFSLTVSSIHNVHLPCCATLVSPAPEPFQGTSISPRYTPRRRQAERRVSDVPACRLARFYSTGAIFLTRWVKQKGAWWMEGREG